MRKLLAVTGSVAITFTLSTAYADEAPLAAEERSFGTTPAAPTQAAPPQHTLSDSGEASSTFRAVDAPIASDPPPDWAILHAGLRPRLGTFGGIATFALAHARTERFYGGFSLSAIRNDAGTHIGLAQIALGRNLSDTFIGGLQLSLTENRARNFVGLTRTTLAYNRSLDTIAVAEIAAYNRARSFAGVTQLAPYNRADKSFDGIVQLGAANLVGTDIFPEHGRGARFTGVGQVGGWNAVDGDFYGLTQIGAASLVSDNFTGVTQIGLFAGAHHFKGLLQTGVVALSGDSIGLQIGAGALAIEEHTGVQIGAATIAESVTGAQIGAVNMAKEVKGVQIGVFNHARHLEGVQIGLANHAEDGVLPWTTILNIGFGDGDNGGVGEEDYPPSRGAVGALTPHVAY